MAGVLVCRGCKGRAAFVERLRDELGPDVELQMVRCQKICHGPVVGTKVDGRLEWFERMSKPKRIRSLAKLVRRGKRLPGRLESVRVRKRSGTPAR